MLHDFVPVCKVTGAKCVATVARWAISALLVAMVGYCGLCARSRAGTPRSAMVTADADLGVRAKAVSVSSRLSALTSLHIR